MDRRAAIERLRAKLQAGGTTIGSWMQIPHASVAEIMGQAGYDWIAFDLEHGSIDVHQLPDLCRAVELGDTLPLVRLAQAHPKDCKQALDAGAGGVIAPMISHARQLMELRDACRWPPAGLRGVGFSRANLFGKNFAAYRTEAQAPMLVAMIESKSALRQLSEILAVEGLDAVLIGPYDLSASMGMTAQFDAPEFIRGIAEIRERAAEHRIPCGVHVVTPSLADLEEKEREGFKFIAYGTDALFLMSGSKRSR
jgi:2-dehydro-3-deoxyglucarate aldolase